MLIRRLVLTGLCLAAIASPPPAAEAQRARNRIAAAIASAESELAAKGTVDPRTVTFENGAIWDNDRDGKGEARFIGLEPVRLRMQLRFEGSDLAKQVEALNQLARMDEERRRPPRVRVVWGNSFPTFEGVIESIGLKYTIFTSDGTPGRAEAGVSLVRAGSATTARCHNDDDCEQGEACVSGWCQARTP
jgi:contractile injection system tube protein